MSLETQVGALVTASNALTTEVSGKVAEINASVAAMQGDIVSALYFRYHVDSIGGSDLNDGSEANPVQTIAQVAILANSGMNIQIALYGDQTHIVDRATFSNNTISLYTYTGTDAIIKGVAYGANNRVDGFILFGCDMSLFGIELEGLFDADKFNAGAAWSLWNSIIARVDAGIKNEVYFRNCILNKSDIQLVKSSLASPGTNVGSYNCTFLNDVAGSAPFFNFETVPTVYMEVAATRYAGMGDTDMVVGAGTSAQHLLTNVTSMRIP